RLLQFGIGRHTALAVLVRQLEHRKIEAVETGQSDELEPIAHLRDITLEVEELIWRQLLAPVEARRAVVGQDLAGKLAVDRIGKTLRLGEVGFACLPPQEIGIGRIGEAARNRVFDAEPWADSEEALRGALVTDER